MISRHKNIIHALKNITLTTHYNIEKLSFYIWSDIHHWLIINAGKVMTYLIICHEYDRWPALGLGATFQMCYSQRVAKLRDEDGRFFDLLIKYCIRPMVTDLPGPGSELETTGCILQLLVKIPNAFSLNWTIYDNGEENSDFYNAIKVTPDRARLAIAFISSSLCPGLLKYLINRHNCDTISNEPFIEPHFYNLEMLHQPAVPLPTPPSQMEHQIPWAGSNILPASAVSCSIGFTIGFHNHGEDPY